jgi:hypothetical protein
MTKRIASPVPESNHQADGDTDTTFPFGANGTADETTAPAETSQKPATEPEAPDPFDPAALRIGSDFNQTVGLKKAILGVPVRKPDKAWWVRVSPDPTYRLQTAVIEMRGDRGTGETYLVAPALRADLATEPTFRPKLFLTAVNTQGVLFLWECNLPKDDREDNWSKTSLAAVELATKGWVRVAANMSAGGYDAWQATGNLPDPPWPEMPFREILKLAFKDKYIDKLDHPVLRRLRGEA